MSTPSYSPSESPFLEQVRRTIRLKHMSRRTEKSYLYYILDESRSNTFGDRLYEGMNIQRATGLTTISTDALNCPIFDR